MSVSKETYDAIRAGKGSRPGPPERVPVSQDGPECQESNLMNR